MKSSGEIAEVKGGRIVRSASRKDRHSKICTAKGPRDRRVRLSAHTAIKFYDVQDRLGYDRPSKAVDWLMKHAKARIDELVPASVESSGSASEDLRLSLQSFQDGIFSHQNAAFFINAEQSQGEIFLHREPLQSSNLPLLRPWMESVDQELINQSSSSIGFSGFRIPARIQGEEELDGISNKLFSRSSASYQ